MKISLQILIVLISVIAFCGGCAKEGCTDPTATNYNSKATKSDGSCKYVCNATDYTLPGNCGSGYIPVSSTLCCPASQPYYCSNSTSCFTTCESAQNVCNYPSKGTGQGGGGSAGYVCSGSSCSYVSSGASYTSLSSCQSSCGGGSAGYVCSGGNCSYVSSGASYTSLSSCQSNCAATCNSTYYHSSTVGCATGELETPDGYCCPSTYPYICSGGSSCASTCANAKSICGSSTIYHLY